MTPFTYHRADSVAQAVDMLQKAKQGMVLAGGMSLIPALKHHQTAPSDVVDLGGLAGLAEIMINDRMASFGAMATHGAIAAHEGVRAKLPGMADLTAVVGDPAVRARGTIGGAMAAAETAADYPAALLALKCRIITRQRELEGDGFITGPFQTVLEPDEIITRIDMAVPKASGYAKFRHPASRYAMVGVFVAQYDDGVRVGVTGAAAMAFRWHAAEAALSEDFAAHVLKDLPPEPADYQGDLYGAPDYRRHLVGVMATRAVKAAHDR